AGERTYLREVRAGSSYLCHDALEAHFGLGKATAIDLLRVEWPSGRKTVLGRTESNQTLVIREPGGR
ncbi:MAG: ASPIC/UnbV domain-containing protein, partial [Planctomycetota bacterium]|nr:ASPIC/UnbV domain-containing protein [Planctomycetota bacterium]